MLLTVGGTRLRYGGVLLTSILLDKVILLLLYVLLKLHILFTLLKYLLLQLAQTPVRLSRSNQCLLLLQSFRDLLLKQAYVLNAGHVHILIRFKWRVVALLAYRPLGGGLLRAGQRHRGQIVDVLEDSVAARVVLLHQHLVQVLASRLDGHAL